MGCCLLDCVIIICALFETIRCFHVWMRLKTKNWINFWCSWLHSSNDIWLKTCVTSMEGESFLYYWSFAVSALDVAISSISIVIVAETFNTRNGVNYDGFQVADVSFRIFTNFYFIQTIDPVHGTAGLLRAENCRSFTWRTLFSFLGLWSNFFSWNIITPLLWRFSSRFHSSCFPLLLSAIVRWASSRLPCRLLQLNTEADPGFSSSGVHIQMGGGSGFLQLEKLAHKTRQFWLRHTLSVITISAATIDACFTMLQLTSPHGGWF